MKKSGDGAADKGRGSGKYCACGSEEHFVHRHYSLCRILEHRTRNCEERQTEKGTMPAKMNALANSEVGLMSAMVGTAQRDGND